MNSAVVLRLKVIAALVVLMVAVFFFDKSLGGQLQSYGIVPRQIDSLWCILTAPFLHANWQHLVNNIIALSIFSAFFLLRSLRFYVFSSLFVIVVGGFLVWCFGRGATHIGASGWVFGLWALSLSLAYLERSFQSIVIALGVLMFYGGMVFGVLPLQPGVSFESHLFGAIAGAIFGVLYCRIKRAR